MKKVLFFLLILNFPFCRAQQNVIDSIQTALKTAKEDTNKVLLLNALGRIRINVDILEEGLANIEMALKLANKLNYKRGLGNAITQKGNYFLHKGEYDKSLNEYLNSLKIAEERKDRKGIAAAYNNIGSVYRYIGDYPRSLDFYFKCLSIMEEMRYEKGIVAALTNIGTVYTYLKEFDKSLNCFKRSLALAQKLDLPFEIATDLSDIGTVYLELNDLEKALEYHMKALKLKEELKDNRGIQASLSNIGLVYSELHEKEKALEYHFKALKMAEEVGDKQNMALSHCNLGHNLIRFGKLDEALVHAQKSMALANEIGTLTDKLEAEKLLSMVYEEKKDGMKALEHYKLYQLINDTIMNEENIKKNVRLEMNFNFAKKEAISNSEKQNLAAQNEIQLLQISRKNYIMLGLAGLILIIATVAWLIINQNKLKARQTAIQLEQKLLRSQMNPHFIFNALGTIESYIYENQPKEAGRYLSDFARLMRLILENSATEYITLEKEIKTLEYYLSLQKLRLENNLTFTIETAETLDTSDVMIPPMLTQPFIENAIEHGFRGSKQMGIVNISFKEVNDQLVVEVKDNGIGINKAKENEKGKQHKSMAMQITKERLAVLNRSKKQKLTFSVSDISDENKLSTGTKVIFSMPL